MKKYMSQQLIYVVLGVVFVIFIIITLRDWSNQRKMREQQPVNKNNEKQDIGLPLCLQAYERLVVFLERIRPENLIGRVIEPGLGVKDVRMLMIHSIQTEFEHNVSQQIYVSTEAWEAVSNAKEQLVSLINSVAEKVAPEADGKVLGKQLLELSLKEKDFPARTALQILNDEAKKLIGYQGYVSRNTK
jgi:hypothetical protein